MKKILLYLVLSLSTLHGQDAKNDFKQINRAYVKLEKMNMRVSYELFFDEEQKSTEREEGFYARNQNEYYIKQAATEMLVTNDHLLAIDHETKTVILDEAKVNSNPLDPLKINLDTLFNLYESITFYTIGGNDKLYAYTFKIKNGPYERIDVVFDPKTFYITEITNTYREKMPDGDNKLRKARLKTSFTNLKTNKLFATDFNESHYVVNSNKKIRLTKKYSGYKLLTNLKNL